MTIGILGAGNVGMALARALVAAQTDVYLGVPEPAKYRGAVSVLGPRARLGSVAQVLEACSLAILAVPYAAALEIAEGVADWGGRILVDATNPLAPGLSGLSVGTTTSGAEQIAARAPSARVIKAFNTTGAENLEDSRYADVPLWMPVCGDDSAARAEVMGLATSIGFRAVDLGDLNSARYLEPFALTWIHLAIKKGFGRDFAFAIVER